MPSIAEKLGSDAPSITEPDDDHAPDRSDTPGASDEAQGTTGEEQEAETTGSVPPAQRGRSESPEDNAEEGEVQDLHTPTAEQARRARSRPTPAEAASKLRELRSLLNITDQDNATDQRRSVIDEVRSLMEERDQHLDWIDQLQRRVQKLEAQLEPDEGE